MKTGPESHGGAGVQLEAVLAVELAGGGAVWRQLYKNRSSRKIDSGRLFPRE